MSRFLANRRAREVFSYALNKEAIRKGKTNLDLIDQACLMVGFMLALCVGSAIYSGMDLVFGAKFTVLGVVLSLIFVYSKIHPKIKTSIRFIEKKTLL